MKNGEMVERILRWHPEIPGYKGCDEYKSGTPEDECRGIAVSLVPTMEVLKKAVELGCNLLITHEPIYYQTPDFPCWRGGFENVVQQEKQAFIEAHGLTIWRDHDHMHFHRPDAIFSGVIHELGWDAYDRSTAETASKLYFPLELPETTVAELAAYLVEKIGMNGLRYLGRDSDRISRIAFVGHLYPNSFGPEHLDGDGHWHSYCMEIMRAMERDGIQAILPGEIIEWTILSYIRDGIAQGRPMACFNLGHFNWEELGMRAFSRTIETLTAGEAPVQYIPTEDTWQYNLKSRETET